MYKITYFLLGFGELNLGFVFSYVVWGVVWFNQFLNGMNSIFRLKYKWSELRERNSVV